MEVETTNPGRECRTTKIGDMKIVGAFWYFPEVAANMLSQFRIADL